MILIERRLEYRRGFIAAYVDFQKAFDSVDRRTLWDLLRRCGIPAGILSLISALYSDTESAIKSGGDVSRFFQVKYGVRQGCFLAPTLFNNCIDWVMGETEGGILIVGYHWVRPRSLILTSPTIL